VARVYVAPVSVPHESCDVSGGLGVLYAAKLLGGMLTWGQVLGSAADTESVWPVACLLKSVVQCNI